MEERNAESKELKWKIVKKYKKDKTEKDHIIDDKLNG